MSKKITAQSLEDVKTLLDDLFAQAQSQALSHHDKLVQSVLDGNSNVELTDMVLNLPAIPAVASATTSMPSSTGAPEAGNNCLESYGIHDD
ncbi:Hypothetical protein PHPALM_18534 [Phytophthora palmivora]|uniref:Uncharacterized protein n=1 Tax=Phytophthora palmivora TaxID=4796 RepID=A0A2P4XJH7_9STRA|nr:Hypothetical protein PHPALM_18534 [Phytophthora palmivora]